MSDASARRTEALFPLALGPILLALFVSASRGPFAEHRTTMLVCLGVAGAAWALAVAGADQVPSSPALRWGIVAGAVALRLVVWMGDPKLSDDVHRYVWEGALVAEGESPYAYAPSAPERADERALRPEVYARMNHVEVSAAYPPVAQLAFAAVVRAVESLPTPLGPREPVRGMRLLFGLCDLGVLLLLLAALRARGLPEARAVAWGWSPLVALEFTGSAHFDSLGILLVLAGTLALDRSRATTGRRAAATESAGFVLLGASVLVKLLPVALVPFALRAARARLRGLVLLLLALCAGSVPVLLWQGGTRGLFGGLSEYALRWESFSLLFRWLDVPFEHFLERDETLLDARRVARACSGILWVAVGLVAWRRRFGPQAAAAALFGAFVLLTPTLHPWYLAWPLPFLCLGARRLSPAWTLLLVSAPLLYWPLTEWQAAGVWREPSWLWIVVAGPFLLLLTREFIVRRRDEERTP